VQKKTEPRALVARTTNNYEKNKALIIFSHLPYFTAAKPKTIAK